MQVCLQKYFLQIRWVCFREKGDLGDKDKSVDLQLSPYQSMRRLGSKELKWYIFNNNWVKIMKSEKKKKVDFID